MVRMTGAGDATLSCQERDVFVAVAHGVAVRTRAAMRRWLSRLTGPHRPGRSASGAGSGALAGILDRERGRLSSLLSAMEAGVLFVDEQGRVAYANPAFAGLWPNAAPAMGLTLGQAVPVPDLLARGEAELDDGRILAARASVVTGPEALSGGTLWVFTDVTAERRLTRDLLAAKEAAEAKAEAKATFLATISHEIRASLNGVIGMAGLLLDSRLDKHQRGYADAVRVSAESLLVSLHDVLDFARMDASGKLTLEEHAFEILPLVEGVVDILGPRRNGRAVEMECHLGSDVQGEFLADSRRLRQVLANLAGNALKFTERGRVDVTAAVTADGHGRDWLHVTVADTGIGIPAEAQARLFERAGGSGLGVGGVEADRRGDGRRDRLFQRAGQGHDLPFPGSGTALSRTPRRPERHPGGAGNAAAGGVRGRALP